MAADVTIAGHKFSKTTVFVVGGGAGLAAFLWWRHQQAAASSSSSTAASATDPYPPDGTTGNPSDPYSTDPATGMTYGDEALSGYGGAGYGSGGYGPGGYNPGGTGNPPTTPGPGSFTSNAQWASYAEQNLSFLDPTALSAAIGVYLTGRPASSDQVGMIDQAIAIAGYPPVAGPNGFPPQIQQGGTGGGQVTVPNVVGQNWLGAIHQLEAAGLKPSPSSKPKGAKDPITSQNPAAGTQVNTGSTVTIKGK